MRRHFASNLHPPISQHRRLSLESAPRGSLRICRRLHVNEPAFGRHLSHACPRSISPVRRCDGNCFVLQHRNVHNSGWVLFDGIITLILGFLIWAHWPSSSVWVIGTLIGVSLIFSGISRFMLSWLSGASLQHRCNRRLHDSGKWQTRPYAPGAAAENKTIPTAAIWSPGQHAPRAAARRHAKSQFCRLPPLHPIPLG